MQVHGLQRLEKLSKISRNKGKWEKDYHKRGYDDSSSICKQGLW